MRRKARQVRSIETTNAILIAAAQVLEDQGYARSTTDRIAARAGVSIGSVYQYFGNKLELFERMFDRECDLIVSGLQNYSIDENAAPYENLERLLGISKGNITPGQFRELSRIPELKGKIAYVSEVILCTIADFVGHFQPGLRDDERRIKADLIVTTAQSLGFRARDKKYHGKLLDEFYRMINRYIVSES